MRPAPDGMIDMLRVGMDVLIRVVSRFAVVNVASNPVFARDPAFHHRIVTATFVTGCRES